MNNRKPNSWGNSHWAGAALAIGVVFLLWFSQGAEPTQSPIIDDSSSLMPTETSALVDPGFVSKYDLATNDDLFYGHLLRPHFEGEYVHRWQLVDDLHQLGKACLVEYNDSLLIANEIAGSYPIEGQPATEPIQVLVRECADILNMREPTVFIKNDPVAQAYVAGMGEETIMVMTSGLLRLYEGREGELRFVIGHELGHAKCDHTKLKPLLAYAIRLMTLISAKSTNETVRSVLNHLPGLATGRLLSWGRSAEMSADRAGLLCCQDERAAYNALQRLLHGLRHDSTWLDPNSPTFDEDQLLKSLKKWEDRPLIEFVLDVRQSRSTHPFVPDRLAALKSWAKSGSYKQILARTTPAGDPQSVTIDVLLLKNLTAEGESTDPYVRVFVDDGVCLETVIQTNMERDAAWANIVLPSRLIARQPIYFEVMDHNSLWTDSIVGAFAVDFQPNKNVYATPILWDVADRKQIARTGLAKVKLHTTAGELNNNGS